MPRRLPATPAESGSSAAAKRPPVVLTDPRAIKALAHPARLAIIDEFFSGRRLTATECAEIAGLSASAMSYHLRALEKWGIIRRSESSDDGRERPWEAAGAGLRIESTEPRASYAGESLLIDRMLDRQRGDVRDWLTADPQIRQGWDDAMTVSGIGYWLTAEETTALGHALQEQLDRFARRSDDELPEGVRRVRINISVVPTARTSPER